MMIQYQVHLHLTDTDIGKIQIGDRYHACVASNDLSPPEGQECEKRLVKNFKVNSLPAR